MIDKLHYIIL